MVSYRSDVIIVGGGAAGAVAALRAREAGFEALILNPQTKLIEKPALFWLPTDQYQDARQYLDQVLGAASVAGAARRHQFLVAAAKIPEWLASYQIVLEKARIGDNYPKYPGGSEAGRVWQLPKRASGFSEQLFAAALKNEVSYWANTRLVDFIEHDAQIVGVQALRAGRQIEIYANHAVVLTQGGFGSDIKLRRQYVPGTRVAGSLTDDDGGHIIRLATQHGLELENMSQVWGVPGLIDPVTGHMIDATEILKAPNSMLVDETGRRFAAETSPAIHSWLGRVAWLIMDAKHRKSVALGELRGGRVSKKIRESGRIVAADSLAELAQAIHIDPIGLTGSVERFDEFCNKGEDGDFGRKTGSSKRNTSLGKIEQPPFYAIRIEQADYGTKGGLKIDEAGRAYRERQPLAGLYAAGSAAASITTIHSPGAGMAQAEAICFAWSIFNP